VGQRTGSVPEMQRGGKMNPETYAPDTRDMRNASIPEYARENDE